MKQMVGRMGVCLVGVCTLWALGGAAAPEPDPVPSSWQLDLEVGPLRVTSVRTEEGVQAFYYLTYTVTNNSGEDLLFAPAWYLATGKGEIFPAGRGVSRAVTQELLARHANPVLESQLTILGRLLQGPENAREGLVVWPAKDLRVDRVNVYAEGFSGEFAVYEVGNPATGEVEEFTLRKTYSLRYCTGGELFPQRHEELGLCERPRWIMR